MSDIVQACQECKACSRMKLRPLPETTAHLSRGHHSLQRWQVNYTGPLPLSERVRYALTCIDTESGLTQAYPVPKANQTHTIKALTKLMAAYRTPQVIKSDQDSHSIGTTVWKWSKENNIEWQFHLPYNLMGMQLMEQHNGILKAIRPCRGGLRDYTKCWEIWMKDPERPSILHMLQTTWASPLRIQIKRSDTQLRPQVGMISNVLLPAPENLESGTCKVRSPWEVQVGPKWHGLLAP